MKVLVCAPTHRLKDYCLEQYLAGYEALRWPEKELLLVDNSENDLYLRRLLERGVWALRPPVIAEDFRRRYFDSWKVIADVSEGYDLILSLETDCIPLPDILELMVPWLQSYRMVRHYYPWKDGAQDGLEGIVAMGCTLFRRDMLVRAMQAPYEGRDSAERRLLGQAADSVRDVLLSHVAHLDEPRISVSGRTEPTRWNQGTPV